MVNAKQFQIRCATIGELPRTLRLGELEAIYEGTNYDIGLSARRYPWTQERDESGRKIPLDERKPYRVNLAAYIVDTSVSWLVGEKRFPAFTVEDQEDGPTGQWIDAIKKALDFQLRMVEVATAGGACGTAVAVGKVIGGYLRMDVLEAKDCHPTFGPDGKTITELVYLFKAPGSFFVDMDVSPKYEGLDPDRWYWFKRIYTPNEELWYELEEVTLDGRPPRLDQVDETRSHRHGFGILPCAWFRNLPSKDPLDGKCSFYPVLDLLTPIDELYSGAFRSIRKLSDPTAVMTNVPPGADPKKYVALGTSSGGVAASPGDMKLLEMSGTGQAAAKEWANEFRAATLRIARTPDLDPEKLSGAAQSGYALEILHGPLLALVGLLRGQYGPGMVHFIRQFLELVAAVKARKKTLFVDDAPETAPDPKAKIAIRWGRYFEPTATDVQSLISNASSAVREGFLSRKTAMEAIAPLFGVIDIEAERKQIEKERTENPGIHDLLFQGGGDDASEDELDGDSDE